MKTSFLNSKKTLTFVSSLLLFILLLLLLSFSGAFKKNRVKIIQTAFLNSKNKERLEFIKLSESSEEIVMKKNGNLWSGRKNSSDFSWPCDMQTLENLISNLCEIVSLEVISDSREDETYGLDKENAFCLNWKIEGGQSNFLYFGKENKIDSRVALKIEGDEKIYSCKTALVNFLKTDQSFFADPFIIPQSLSRKNRNEAEKELRRGRLAEKSFQDEKSPVWEKIIYEENGSSVILSVYENNESYLVKSSYRASPSMSEEEKYVFESMKEYYSVSSWTFEKMKEKYGL